MSIATQHPTTLSFSSRCSKQLGYMWQIWTVQKFGDIHRTFKDWKCMPSQSLLKKLGVLWNPKKELSYHTYIELSCVQAQGQRVFSTVHWRNAWVTCHTLQPVQQSRITFQKDQRSRSIVVEKTNHGLFVGTAYYYCGKYIYLLYQPTLTYVYTCIFLYCSFNGTLI